MSTPRQKEPLTPKGQNGSDSTVPKKVKKSVVPRLKKSSIALTSIRNLVKEELEGILDSVLAKISPLNEICLVLDPHIVGPLTLIIPFKSLTDKKVDAAIHTIDDPAWNSKIETIVYLSRPRIDSMKKISAQIQELEKLGKKSYHLYLIPRKTLISEITLQKCGVYHLIQQPIGEFGLDVLPVDNDLLSMEVPYVYRELAMDSDNSSLYFIARTILKMQSMYGVIPRIKYIGTNGLRVAQMISALRSKLKSNYSFPPNVQIGNLILFDRSVDMVTPFLTQLTYEGLIDELYGISNNLLSLDFMKDKKKEKRSKLPLNDDDEVFVQVRHKNFNAVGKQLHKEANVITELYDEKNKMQNSKVDIKVIKDFVQKLPALQQRHEDLGTHISLAQTMRDETSKSSFRKNIEIEQNILRGENEDGVLDYIEELIIKQESLTKILRLICLLSTVNEGLTDKAFDGLRKELIHSFGYVIMMTLYNLEYCGLIKRREGRSSWPSIRKTLQLVEEEIDEEKPKSISFTYSGYAPLSIRIIEKFGLSDTKDKWQELKNIFPDQEVGEIVQSDHTDPSTMVFFIGGVTYAEISAFRWLTQEKFLGGGKGTIATTKIINGNTFIGSLFDTPE